VARRSRLLASFGWALSRRLGLSYLHWADFTPVGGRPLCGIGLRCSVWLVFSFHFVFLHFVVPTCSQLVFSPPSGGMWFFSVSRCLPLALFLIAARVLTPRGFPAHPPWIGRQSSSYACRLSILWGRLFVPCMCVGILPTFPILIMLLWLY
jgi:hypothetical protein